MKVSVLIPALNEATRIEQAVARAWEAGAAEVIVADGGSSDGTWERLATLPCQALQTPPGRARQQNAAVELATSEVLLFLHADTWLTRGAVAQIATSQRPVATLWGAFRQHIEAAGAMYRALEWGNAVRARWLRRPYGDQGIFVARQLFASVGGFPNVPLLEDLLLARQLGRLAPCVLLPGPLQVSARRWQKHGVVRQTVRNWSILAAHAVGYSPEQLVSWYRRHDR